jgi:cysteine desulfurase
VLTNSTVQRHRIFVCAQKCAHGQYVFGGEQEKGLRPGTEATHNITGMAMALELSLQNLELYSNKSAASNGICSNHSRTISWIQINGSADGFYNIANVMLPFLTKKQR